MDNNGSNDSNDSNGMIYLVVGAALVVAGAGLIMAHPGIRQQVRENLGRVLPPDLLEPGNIVGGLSTIVPDFERYMKLRNM